jgi:hypothetical protein
LERRDVIIENQFGAQRLTVKRADTLCVPAEKDQVPSELNINHFKCYKVKRAKGTPKFTPRTVDLGDQFETKATNVLVPRFLCNPVEKRLLLPITVHPIVDPENHLACYKIKDVPGQPRFERRQVDIEDQFGDSGLPALRGDCRQSTFVCVPSTKRLASPSGAFLDVTSGVLE